MYKTIKTNSIHYHNNNSMWKYVIKWQNIINLTLVNAWFNVQMKIQIDIT